MAADDDAPPRTIRSLLAEADARRNAVESSPDTSSPAHAAAIETAVGLYRRTLDAVAAASVFSPNEDVEEVGTSDIPLLCLRFRIAELLARTPSRDLTLRKAALDEAAREYGGFLDVVDGYGLVVRGGYGKLLERFREGPQEFAVAGGPGGDAASRRAAKIANFQAEKELRTKLDTLRRNPRYLDEGDDEVVRALHLAEVTFAVHTTFNALDSINRERELLASAPPPSQPPPPLQHAGSDGDPLSRPRASDHDPTLRLDPTSRPGMGGGPLLSREGRPLQPFTLLGSGAGAASRQDLRRGVFRPGHNLPTMSIDEYLEEEKRRGNIIQGGGEPAKPELDEDDMDAVDRETYKAREWDEFTDHNPKGSGNTLNMG